MQRLGSRLSIHVSKAASDWQLRQGWSAVRARLGAQLNLPKYTQVHHWLIPQGGKGALSLRGFFNEQWGRFVLNVIKNSRWNLMVPPEGYMGRASQMWHSGLHGKGDWGLSLVGRLWHGSPGWAKGAALTIPGVAGLATYFMDEDK